MPRKSEPVAEEKPSQVLFPHTVIISGNDYVVMASGSEDLEKKIAALRELLSSPVNDGQ